MPVLLLLLVLVEEGAGRNVVQFTENSRHRLIKKTDSTGNKFKLCKVWGMGKLYTKNVLVSLDMYALDQ